MRKILSLLLAVAVLLTLAVPALAYETFATSQVLLDGSREAVAGETSLGDLIADAMLWYATGEVELEVVRQNVVALTHSGAIHGSIQKGQITEEDIRDLLPGGDTVTVVYVSGDKLLETLEASTYCLPEPLTAFPQVSGMEFTVNTAIPYDRGEPYGDTGYYAPASIGRVTIQSAGGWSFDKSATYAVVTNSFVSGGGDAYYALAPSGRVVDTGERVDEVVMDYIAHQLGGVITDAYGQSRGRIHIVAEAPAQPMWYDQAVKTVTEAGVMTGTGNGFAPDATVTRATVFQTLYNLEGKPSVTGSAFPDAVGTWYEPAANWAFETGLTSGTGEGFAGDREITRAEIVVILNRYAQHKGADMSAGENVELLSAYLDAELLTVWSVDAFEWAVGAGVISGKTDPTGASLLAPGQNATRAELAQILVNFMDFFPQSRPVTHGAAEPQLPDSRADYPSDEAYANFREVSVGDIAPRVLYRSSSPIDPGQGGRRLVADNLLKATGVKTVVNTSDCRQRFTQFEGYDETYYSTLNHVALRMEEDFSAEAFVEDLRNGLEFMSEEEGPYLIHGTQGVERTGYVCMVLEAFMGATKDEVIADYMRSYADYHQLEPGTEIWQALEAKAEGYLAIFAGGRADLAKATENYLLQVVGLTQKQLELLREHLS